MKVGILTGTVSRRSGGLAGAIAPLAKELAYLGNEIILFSGSVGSEKLDGNWTGVEVNLLQLRWPLMMNNLAGLGRALDLSMIDVLHVHGLWTFTSFSANRWRRRCGKPSLVSPHGMLDPWALSNSRWKKKLVSTLYESENLRDSSCIHALCQSEYRAIRSYGLTNPVAIIPNGVDVPQLESSSPSMNWLNRLPDTVRVLLFLGRIHPKKGLNNLLRAFAMTRIRFPELAESWCLVIAGWDQNGHQADLIRLCQTLGIKKHVVFVGPQFDNDKIACLNRADAFVLPSFSEGLPMSVLEAWSYGLPVLMTTQCNLPDGFVCNAAIQIEPDVESISDGLFNVFNLTDEQLLEIGKNGLKLVREQFSWPNIAASTAEVYRWVLGEGPKPDCVRLD